MDGRGGGYDGLMDRKWGLDSGNPKHNCESIARFTTILTGFFNCFFNLKNKFNFLLNCANIFVKKIF